MVLKSLHLSTKIMRKSKKNLKNLERNGLMMYFLQQNIQFVGKTNGLNNTMANILKEPLKFLVSQTMRVS